MKQRVAKSRLRQRSKSLDKKNGKARMTLKLMRQPHGEHLLLR